MIASNDLRRYNLVYRISDKSIQKVNTIFCNSVCLLGCNDSYDCQEIEPIPLTPEILEKSGFDKDNWFLFKKGGNGWHTYLFKMKGEGLHYGYVEDGQFTEETQQPIKYVHQIQNLIFALTGEELNIQLNAKD